MTNPNQIPTWTGWLKAIEWGKSGWVSWKIDALLNDEFKEFIKSIDIKWLWERPHYHEMNNREKIESLMRELDIFINFKWFLEKYEGIQQLFNHDVRHTFNLEQTREFIISLSESNPGYLEKNIDEYIRNIDSLVKIFLSFIESLYFVLNLESSWIESKKRTLSLWELINLCKWDDSTIDIDLTKPDIEVIWIIWDIIMFIKNILSNAKKHNPQETWLWERGFKEKIEKLQVKITSERIWNSLKMLIKDNGTWIPETILPHIFESWTSWGWSTGLGLRDLEKRWIVARASNDGLTNTQWWKWAKFEIDLPISQKV